MNPTPPRIALLTALVVSACEPAPTASVERKAIDIAVLSAKGTPGGQKCALVLVGPAVDTIPVGGQVALTDTVVNKKRFIIADAVVAWSSQNPTIAVVNSNGLVTGIAVGDATIVATCAKTGVTGSSSITVWP